MKGPGRALSALLLAPSLAILAITFLLPVATLARMSLNTTQPGGAIVETLTLANYASFLSDEFYWEISGTTLLLAVIVTITALLVAYPIALFLFRWESPWRGPLAVLTISPLLVSGVVRTYGWIVLLGDQGPVNALVLWLRLSASPLKLSNNFLGAVIGLTEILTPYMALALIAGFGRLDRAAEEAAETLGATPWRTFIHVTLPLSLPGILLGSLLCFVLAVSSFVTPRLLGGGRVFTLATEIYEAAMLTLNWPLAATISMLMLALFGITLVAYGRLMRAVAI
jgi:putative spermidine/putrescine transport system permease protein